jgi:hypothetical protein
MRPAVLDLALVHAVHIVPHHQVQHRVVHVHGLYDHAAGLLRLRPERPATWAIN